MGFIGKLAGGTLGYLAGGLFGDSKTGSQVGEFVGDLVPFKKGGKVKRTGPALLHAGEFVLPKGVKPTKAQKSAVAKGKKSRK